MKLSDRVKIVPEIRYLLKNEKGEVIETPKILFHRVANYIAQAEKFYELMSSLRFIPNSPVLMNAGKSKSQLAACFVLPINDINDCIKSIFKTFMDDALFLQIGGGIRFNFFHLRPKEDIVRSKEGLKGITIFRYGSKRRTLLKLSDAHLSQCGEVKGRIPLVTRFQDSI